VGNFCLKCLLSHQIQVLKYSLHSTLKTLISGSYEDETVGCEPGEICGSIYPRLGIRSIFSFCFRITFELLSYRIDLLDVEFRYSKKRGAQSCVFGVAFDIPLNAILIEGALHN